MSSRATSKRIRVLIADDDLLARAGWRTILDTAEDIDVVDEAVTAQDIYDKARECAPDVVLIDLKWFGDTSAGATAIKEIKAAMPEVRVIAVTAYEELIGRARNAGADAGLTKTFSRDELLTMIRTVARREQAFAGHKASALEPISLSQREMDVLRLVSRAESDRQIAHELGIAESTVKSYVQSILTKLGAKNRMEACLVAREHGIL